MVANRTSAVERLLTPADPNLSRELANYLLGFEFDAEDRRRCVALSEKAKLGLLSTEEQIELADLVTADDLLTILQVKARASVRKNPAA